MTCLAYPLDIAFGSDSEIFDDTKWVYIYLNRKNLMIKKKCRYRRSYDSEYSASQVDHHVWPALMQGSRVIVKVLF